jgi:hypothetical protein
LNELGLDATDAVCVVCSEALTEDRATCGGCMQEFHLALRIDRPARDCGETWIDEDTQTLAFGCNVCLGRVEPPAPESEKKAYARRTGASAREIARGRRRPGRGH